MSTVITTEEVSGIVVIKENAIDQVIKVWPASLVGPQGPQGIQGPPGVYALRSYSFALTDLTSLFSWGKTKAYFRAPVPFTLLSLRASLLVTGLEPTVVNVNRNGLSILSTKLVIDAGFKSSLSNIEQPVMRFDTFDNDDEITFDIDVAGAGAKGLVVTLNVLI